MSGPLDGIRVLDTTQILSGPFSSMLLADMGADVIKVERPGTGDPARGNGPFLGDGDAFSTYFMSINRGKRSICLDLTTSKGKAIFVELAKNSDVLMENFRPGAMKRLGLAYEDLKMINPRLVYVSVSGFGQTGPYAGRPALDVIVQGMGGIMSITGEPDRGPVRVGASVGDITAALFATVGITSALLERERSGQGQYIDIGMMDCQAAIMENAFMRYFALGEIPKRIGTRHPISTPFQAFESKDGYVVVALMGGSTDQWPLFCAAIDHPELIDDERYTSGWLRTKNYDELIPILNETMAQKTTKEWVDVMGEFGLPCGPVQDIEQVANDPQMTERQMFVDVPHPVLGSVKMAGNPMKLSRTPVEPKGAPPVLGEHSEEILREINGLDDSQIQGLFAENIVS